VTAAGEPDLAAVEPGGDHRRLAAAGQPEQDRSDPAGQAPGVGNSPEHVAIGPAPRAAIPPAEDNPAEQVVGRHDPGARVVVAIDVGGTGMKCALVDRKGAIRHSERHPTGAEHGPDAVVERILQVAQGLVDTAAERGETAEAIGVVVPGVVDEERGIAAWSSNVGFRDVPLRDRITERLGLPTALGHDVRAGGAAEARLGAGHAYKHVLFLAIGTGIAGAHVVDGRAFAGAHGAAGELGHIPVRPGGPPCGCGARGCLEAVASAAAIGRAYAARTGQPATAAEVAARAAAGDPDATRVWDEAMDALSDGLVIGITLHDPEAVVIGGGLAEAGDFLMVRVERALTCKLTFQYRPVLLRAALGDGAGCLGAALLALSLVDGGETAAGNSSGGSG
jgi:glucokinase